MSATALILCGFYIKSYLENALIHTERVAKSIGGQVRSAVVEELQRRADAASPPPAPPAEAKRFWTSTAESDPEIAGMLKRARAYWGMLLDVYITDNSGRLLVGTRGYAPDERPPELPLLSDWSRRSLLENLKQIYVDHADTELKNPIALSTEGEPVLVIHVVVSSLFIKESLWTGAKGLAGIGLASVIASLVLAFALPTFVLNPLERLSARLDQMSTDAYQPPASHEPGEAKEFAAVYSKLNALGRKFRGAQENADQLRDNVEQLLERLEEAVLLFDAAGRLTMAGSSARGLLGVDASTLTGKRAEEIFSLEDSALVASIRNGEQVRDKVIPLANDGTTASVLVNVVPLRRPSDGHAMGALVTLRDTESRDELAAHLDVASRLTAVSQLTRGVAHEIKNPLNAIRLHLEVLRARLEEEAPELNVITQEISRLDRVVKTFLDFNRPVQPNLRPLDINYVAAAIAELVSPDAASRNINVQLHKAPQPAMIAGDLDLIKQAVLNVVMNGVEAMSESGGVLTIETCVKRGSVELSVSDTGPGIPPEVQNKIFNLYFSTKSRGSGIGLAMAFRFAQLHGGKIEFSSQLGLGTTFRFTFPEAASVPTVRGLGLTRTHGA
jgi:PAS domain S-box-containing protein